MRGLTIVPDNKRSTSSYPLSTQVFGFIHSAAMKWLTPRAFEKIVAIRGGDINWTG